MIFSFFLKKFWDRTIRFTEADDAPKLHNFAKSEGFCWNRVYQDDHEGGKTVNDDNFIDDSDLDTADKYVSDNEQRSPSSAPQVKAEEGEEDEEIKQLFRGGKKRKKNEKSAAEIALLVENVMAELEVAAEEDAVLNSRSKPSINKLKKLPQLIESRPIFNKSTRFEDMRNYEDETTTQYRRPSMKMPINKTSRMESRDDDLDLVGFSQGQKYGQSSSRQLQQGLKQCQ